MAFQAPATGVVARCGSDADVCSTAHLGRSIARASPRVQSPWTVFPCRRGAGRPVERIVDSASSGPLRRWRGLDVVLQLPALTRRQGNGAGTEESRRRRPTMQWAARCFHSFAEQECGASSIAHLRSYWSVARGDRRAAARTLRTAGYTTRQPQLLWPDFYCFLESNKPACSIRLLRQASATRGGPSRRCIHRIGAELGSSRQSDDTAG